MVLFQVLPASWLLLLSLYLVCTTTPSILHTVPWSLILSGGAGNFLDRALYDGRVVDFMNFGIGTLRTGIFNMADVWMMSGVGLRILHVFQRPAGLTPR